MAGVVSGGSGWLPGGRVGVTTRWYPGLLNVGFEFHGGINDPNVLFAIPDTAGHFGWGTRIFLQVGL
ncbi:MAG: hypothetical protein ACNA8W_04435 [Bradymonadaceae bacterium]